MRPRIKHRVNIEQVIETIEHRVKLYSLCIKDLMEIEQIDYQQAKQKLNRDLKLKLIFKS